MICARDISLVDRPWEDAERGLWRTDDSDVGGEYFHFDEVFSFLIVRNSGHLLPMDKPAVALAMLTRFLNNQSFVDQPLPKESFYRRPLPPMKEAASLGQDSRPVVLIAAGVGLIGLCLAIGWLTGIHWHQSISKGLADADRRATATRDGRHGRTILELTGKAKGLSGGLYQQLDAANDDDDDFGFDGTTATNYGFASDTARVSRSKHKSVTSPVAQRIHQWEKLSTSRK